MGLTVQVSPTTATSTSVALWGGSSAGSSYWLPSSGKSAHVRVDPERDAVPQAWYKPSVIVIVVTEPIALGWRTRQPLVVTVERGRPGAVGEVLATEANLGVYGVGSTVDEAVDDLNEMVVDLYLDLEKSEPILSAKLRQRLQLLRSFVTPP